MYTEKDRCQDGSGVSDNFGATCPRTPAPPVKLCVWLENWLFDCSDTPQTAAVLQIVIR